MLVLNEKMKSHLMDSDLDSCNKYLDTLSEKCPEFIEREGCVLIKSEEYDDEEYDDESNCDKTGYEASYNEFRFEDYFEDFKFNLKERGILSIRFAEIIGMQLRKNFASDKFYVIISYDEGVRTHTLRFHKYRSYENGWIDIERLDQYDQEVAVVILG